MKVLLVNYHYFVNGGPDRYFFNVKVALQAAGYKVVPFSFNYDETIKTKYQYYFPNPVTGKGPCLLAQQRLSKSAKVKALTKMFYNREVNEKFREIIRNEKPDVVYSIYLSATLLPNILKIAKKEFGLPIVYRLSDFHMFCPTYLFCRDGQVCMECCTSLKACIDNRCVKGSKLMSLVRVAQMRLSRLFNYYGYVDQFVAPSLFTRDIMLERGFHKSKVINIPTFSKDMINNTESDKVLKREHILFLGNLTSEKGVDILLKAYCKCKTDMPLEVVGKGNARYTEKLKAIVPCFLKDKVNFRGFLSGDKLYDCINRTAFLVHPVVCYENMPNSVIEMMSLGKPVITSEIGSMPELVQHNRNGLLVSPGDVDALAAAIDDMALRTNLDEAGRHSRYLYEENHTEAKHMHKLVNVFASL